MTTFSFRVFSWLLLAGAALAASPELADISPPGGQIGREVEVVLSGQRLGDAKGILFYDTEIAAAEFTPVDAKTVKAKLKIAPECMPGEHALRVWTASGLTEARTFFAGQYPVIAEHEPNNDAAHAQPVSFETTVAGVVKEEETDWFAVQGKRNQRLTVEVEGIRLGRAMFDPWLSVLNKDGKRLAQNDDSSLFVQDPLISILLPEDGAYFIQLRDSEFGGNGRCHYRLHVTSAPQPLAVYPAGGQAGRDLEVEFLGDPAGSFSQKLQLEDRAEMAAVFGKNQGVTAPVANVIRVSPFANVLEAEPNNDAAHANPTGEPLPLAFNGRIATAGDVDFFRFAAKKDESFDVQVYARRLRSPLDSVLQILDENGRQLQVNDDAGGPDSSLRFKAPADGEYRIAVKDQLGRGGETFVYRAEITPVVSRVQLTLPNVSQKPSQERQVVPVPRGNRYAAMVRVLRTDYGGELGLAAPSLPEGITMESVPGGGDLVPAVFSATADAPANALLCELKAHPSDAKQPVGSGFVQNIPLVIGNPGDTVFYGTSVDKLPVAVTEEAPCTLTLIEPKVPLVQNGSMNLKVEASRRGDFKGPIHISMLYNPAGTGSQASVVIPEGKTEAMIPLNAAGDAQIKTWKIAVVGHADAGNGDVWISSQLANLEVAPPFVTGKIERSKTKQGQPVTVVCNLKQNRAFEGKAKLQLLNLPANTSAPDLEITAEDQEARFEVATGKTTPQGSKKDLFCRLTILRDGELIVHNIASGGILRVDAPPQEKVASTK